MALGAEGADVGGSGGGDGADGGSAGAGVASGRFGDRLRPCLLGGERERDRRPGNLVLSRSSCWVRRWDSVTKQTAKVEGRDSSSSHKLPRRLPLSLIRRSYSCGGTLSLPQSRG